MDNINFNSNGNKIKNSPNQMPAITACRQKFWINIFDICFRRMLNKSFYSMRVKNADNFKLRNPDKGNIIIASHSCWWDGMVGYLIGKDILDTRVFMMIEELYRFPLLSKIGAFSVEKNSAQSAIKALNYSTQIIKDPLNSIWMFPQGFVMPPDYRPVEIASGVSYLCKKTEGANIIPIAHRYNFIREDRPEIFVEIGKPIFLTNTNVDRKEFARYIEEEFTKLLDKQKNDICSGNFEGYEYVFKSKLAFAKRIEQHFKKILQSFK